MKKSILTLCAAALMLAACDKIEPADDGSYTLFAGIGATWTDGPAVGTDQRVLVEKFTGPKCPNCPDADITLDAAHEQLGDKLVVISVNHPVGQGIPFPNDPDLRTDDGTAWDNYYGINAIPSAYINRDKSRTYSGAMSNITADLQSALGESPVLGVEVKATEASERALDITVGLQFVQNYSAPLTLTLALVEDSLVYRQSHGSEIIDDYVHNHMLRDVMTDVWGAEVDATGTAGERRQASFSTYRVKDESIRLENCHVIAFVSDRTTKRVLNTASCTIE